MAFNELWMERVQAVVTQAHEENLGGRHHSGFCEACADAYLVAQYAIPQDLEVEWHVESIGGGATFSTQREVENWIAEWRAEYGDTYEIEVRRRELHMGQWEDVIFGDH